MLGVGSGVSAVISIQGLPYNLLALVDGTATAEPGLASHVELAGHTPLSPALPEVKMNRPLVRKDGE